MKVFLDFETRSRVDLQKAGSWVYSKNPSTDVLCLAVAFEGEEPRLWHPDDTNYYLDLRLEAAALDPDYTFHAHNAAFEQAIWQNIMVARRNRPPIPIERWRCTAAKAAYMSLPRKLEGVTEALNAAEKKDAVGHRIMLKLSKPRQNGEFWEYDDCPDDFEKLYKYCLQDVRAEMAVDALLPDLPKREQKLWFLDQKINMRGVYLDVPTVEQIESFVEQTKHQLGVEFVELVDGQVGSVSQVAKLITWLADNGCELPNLQAPVVDKAIRELSDGDIKRVLEIRRDLSKTSVKKYDALMCRVDRDDNRVRDLFLFLAAITNRWGGRGVQTQNLPRGTVDSGVAIDLINADDFEFFNGCYDDPMGVYSSCIRGVLTASPGNELYVADFSSIEARVLAWVAGQEDVLEAFRRGDDLYCLEACVIFNRTITSKDKKERAVGKVSVLALGYNGGINAYGKMAKGYRVDLAPIYDILWPTTSGEERRKAEFAYKSYFTRQVNDGDIDPLNEPSGLVADIIKQRWRAKNDKIVELWPEVENAAIQAVLTGEERVVGGVNGRPKIIFGTARMTCPADCKEHLEKGCPIYLICKLPSGNKIIYPFAAVQYKKNDWNQVKPTLSYKVEDENTYQFGRKYTYGGRLVENIIQSISRDLLVNFMFLADAANFDITLHCHDEVVADEPLGSGRLQEFEHLATQLPAWAEGLPMGAEAWAGKRYRK